jgi:hypothetical protein
MRNHIYKSLGTAGVLVAGLLLVSAALTSGCGSSDALGLQDWERDLLASLLGLAPGVVPLPVAGPVGPAGAAGAAGPPGPDIIIARAVILPDGTLENSDDVTNVLHPAGGTYQLTIDVTGDVLPAGTTEDDFEVFVTLKETTQAVLVPYYVPVSLVGTDLRIDVLVTSAAALTDHGFSIEVLLPAG